MFVIRPLQPDDEPFQWDMGWEAMAMNAEARAAAGTPSWPSRRSAATSSAWDDPVMRAWSPSPPTEPASGWPGTASFPSRNRAGASSRSTSRSWRSASRPRRGAEGIGGALLDALLALAREQGLPGAQPVGGPPEPRSPAV